MNPNKIIEDLFEGAAKIKSTLRLGALAIGAIVVISFLIPYEARTFALYLILIVVILLIVIICGIIDFKKGTPPVEDVKTAQNIPHDLRVNEDIWDSLDKLLQGLGFNNRDRSASEGLIPGESNYEFSLATGGTSLFIVQLAPEVLLPVNIMSLRKYADVLKTKRHYAEVKLVIICDTKQIYDGIYYSREEGLTLLLNYGINIIKGKQAEAITLLKTELLL